MKLSVSRETRYRGKQPSESIKTLKDQANNSNPIAFFDF